jgi:hypothetical protein
LVFTGAFTTPEHTIYLFADCTVYNNYSALYIINSVSLFKPSSIKTTTFSQTIAVGTTTFPITHRNTYIIKKVLKRPNNALRNLVLTNIVVIKGFYVNIISESELFKKIGL